MNTISVFLHQIDLEEDCIKNIPISESNSDLQDYISRTLVSVENDSQYKEYFFQRETTEVYACLKGAVDKKDLSEQAETISSRLLAQESQVEQSFGDQLTRRGSDSLIRKGSFLQILVNDNGHTKYLGVKLDHHEFLDDQDFTKHLGLAYSKQIHKIVIIEFDSSNKASKVLMRDANTRIASYWWDNFLEATPQRTDETNTAIASKAVILKLGLIKDISPVDYTNLRNAVITEFRKQDTVMNYNDFITRVFDSYVPENSEVSIKMPQLIENLKKLPEKSKFDTQFTLMPSAVTARIRKFKLSEEIELVTKDGIQNINDKVWASESPDGKKLVIIHSEEGHKFFEHKPY